MHVLSFRPEFVLYLYLASCVAVLLFNVAYMFAEKFRSSRIFRRSEEMDAKVLEQVLRLKAGDPVEEVHYLYLKKKLRSLGGMRAFQMGMEELHREMEGQEELLSRYQESLRDVFMDILPVYKKRDDVEQAYFAYMVSYLGLDTGQGNKDVLMDWLEELAVSDHAYSRENALKALYAMGNEEALLRVWRLMEKRQIWHSRKLLADGLGSFRGDLLHLARSLWKLSLDYDPALRLPIMQFIRFRVGQFDEEFYQILQDEKTDKEMRLEAIRYFRRYPYGPAKELLMNFINYQEFIDWEYASGAALSLGSYPGPDTVLCLKEGLRSHNWYVRLNCAETLVYEFGFTALQVADVRNGNDRYAREILQAVWNQSQLENQRMEIRKYDV
ncbi:MAG: hypothetical protein ACOYBE_04395 [Blautia sp.]|jgi:hypothetical protein